MKRKAGFTLIELVTVVVILGTLAVVAAPKFISIQKSAREATIEGIANAMEGVVSQVSAKAYVNGLTPSTSNPGNQQDYILDFGIGTQKHTLLPH